MGHFVALRTCIVLSVVAASPGLSVPSAGAATTFVVTKTTDSQDGTCNADCSLREAVIAANTAPGRDTIVLLAVGRPYVLDLAPSSTSENASLDGDLDLTDDVRFDGRGQTVDQRAADRVLDVLPGVDADVTELTITGGDPGPSGGGGIFNRGDLTLTSSAVTANTTANIGGGILNNTATLRMVATSVTNNTATGLNGGGGGIQNTAGTVEIVDSTLSGNTATQGSGGGIRTASTSALSIVSTSITDNHAQNTSIGGGGIHLQSGAVASITGTRIEDNSSARHGGGIHNSGELTIDTSTISGNDATDVASWGGGIYSGTGPPVTLDLSRTTISGNSSGGTGGGIDVRGSPTSIVSSRILGNEALTGFGGGIYSASPLTVDGSEISSNSGVGLGGGIYNLNNQARVVSTRIWSNDVAGDGGGFANGASASADIIGSSIHDNTATSEGGGIYNGPGDNADITSTTISENTAGTGGGLWNDGGLSVVGSLLVGNEATNPAGAGGGGILNDQTASVENSTLSNNNSATDGGGLTHMAGTTTIVSSTFAFNDAATDDGGGMFMNAATVNLTASIFVNNSAASTGDDCFGTLVTGGSNVLTDANGCTGLGGADLLDSGLFVPALASNGGPTQTHALPSNSSARDRNDGASCGGTDQRGAPRPSGTDCDSGAYEVVACRGVLVNVIGTEGPDVLDGTNGDDGILALGGRDKLFGYGGNDALCGGPGKDKLFGGDGKDVLDGGPGAADKCVGGKRSDRFRGCETVTQ